MIERLTGSIIIGAIVGFIVGMMVYPSSAAITLFLGIISGILICTVIEINKLHKED
ncbi:hypothetical protein [Filobacillus milosensis]|uniref:hypothetical protein n=1 Tax=Filobacillus milosensis TaxID=94137 RepID=UPI00129B43C3|nr:hypothetical protein [Filobacillus milosensis]